MSQVSRAGVLALLVAFMCVGATRVPDVPAPLIDSVPKRASRFWKQISAERTQQQLASDIFRVEGTPGGQPPETVAAVEQVWSRIQAASPVPGQASFYIDDCSQHTAEALQPGAVRICRGFLRVLDEQDQLAAVLAHETSHLILGHLDAARARGTGFAVLQGLQDAAIASSIVWSGGSAAPFYATLVGANDVTSLPTGWMDRANQREEIEADKLGIDLMVKAGFSPQGFLDVLAIEGGDCGALPTVTAPRLALMIDTSKRFTHPDLGKRACAAREYIKQFYSQALSRQTVPTLWLNRGPKLKGAGAALFRDMDRAESIGKEAHDLRVQRLVNPSAKNLILRCSALIAEARGMAARHPADRDFRRLSSATALSCSDYNKAFDALSSEMGPGTRTRPATFQTIAVGILDPNPAPTVGLYSIWMRQDFIEAAQNQKPSLANLLMIQNDAVDAKDEYEAASCVLDSPALKAAYDQFCNEAFGNSPASSTCSSRFKFKGICSTTKYFPYSKPMGALNFLATQSRWYAMVLDK